MDRAGPRPLCCSNVAAAIKEQNNNLKEAGATTSGVSSQSTELDWTEEKETVQLAYFFCS